jgi:hypothetical protein
MSESSKSVAESIPRIANLPHFAVFINYIHWMILSRILVMRHEHTVTLFCFLLQSILLTTSPSFRQNFK